MGLDYASLTISPSPDGFALCLAVCTNADKGCAEETIRTCLLNTGHVFLRIMVTRDGKCWFAYSTDDNNYTKMGGAWHIREGKWVGARIGLFALAVQETGLKGYADFDWFRIK